MWRSLLASLVAVALAPAAAAAADGAMAQVTGALPPPKAPLAVPKLKRSITVTSDIVRLGDLIDNADAFAAIPVFRSPDIGTTGAVPARRVIEAARAHNLFGVEGGDVFEVEVTRAGRVIGRKDIEARIARLFADTNGLGEVADLKVSFDREPATFSADLAPDADLKAMRAARDPRGGRFDVVFEVPLGSSRRTLMRYTGTVIETADAIVPVRTIARGEIVRAQDLTVERRPKAEVTGDIIGTNDEALGRAARQALRPGLPVRRADLVKPDLIKRDDSVMLVYEAPGIMLTTRGKAIESGGEGDIIKVLNAQTNRTLQGVVTGPGRVDIGPAAPPPLAPVASANPLQPADEPPGRSE
jgi:flagella basal body P-ring formation protein FlgA